MTIREKIHYLEMLDELISRVERNMENYTELKFDGTYGEPTDDEWKMRYYSAYKRLRDDLEELAKF